MKGIVLAAGHGTRLRPLTKLFPKSLLPVYNKPLVYYPLLALKRTGIKEIIIVTGADTQGQFQTLLGRGKALGIKLVYAVQDHMGGLAHAISVTEPYVKNSSFAVVLGDNIFEDNLTPMIERYKKQRFKVKGQTVQGAMLVTTQVRDPERSGVVSFEGEKVASIEEKPARPKSNWIITGFLMCDKRAFDFIKNIKPSARGEMEWTDLMQFYLKEGTLTYAKLKGHWIDAGTFDSLLEAGNFVAGNRFLRKTYL